MKKKILLSEKKYLIWGIFLMKCKSKPKYFNLFLRKWRNSIYLENIGKILFSKTPVLMANSKHFLMQGGSAPFTPALFASLHSVIYPHPTHFSPFLTNVLLAPLICTVHLFKWTLRTLYTCLNGLYVHCTPV